MSVVLSGGNIKAKIQAADNFNRANAANLGTNWSIPTGNNGIPIVNNQITQSVFPGMQYYAARSFPPDQFSQLQIISPSVVTDTSFGPAIRIVRGGQAYITQCNTVQIRLYRNNAGAFTQLGADGPAVAANDIIRLEVRGKFLTVMRNSTVIIGPIADELFVSGYPGIWTTAPPATADNWTGGEL